MAIDSQEMNHILLVSVSVLTVGCYPLPSPTYSVSRYGVDATLVDESSGEPLRGKGVTLVIDQSRVERRSAPNGKVSVAASKHRYWTWLGGPIWASASSATIVIEPEGYKPERIEWSAWDRSHAPVEDGRIQAGRVAMTRR